jgi:hypothetical protein
MPHQPFTNVPIRTQDELAKLEKQLRDEHEARIQQRLNFGRTDLPLPGKVRYWEKDIDVDEAGCRFVTEWMDHTGKKHTGRLMLDRLVGKKAKKK